MTDWAGREQKLTLEGVIGPILETYGLIETASGPSPVASIAYRAAIMKLARQQPYFDNHAGSKLLSILALTGPMPSASRAATAAEQEFVRQGLNPPDAMKKADAFMEELNAAFKKLQTAYPAISASQVIR